MQLRYVVGAVVAVIAIAAISGSLAGSAQFRGFGMMGGYGGGFGGPAMMQGYGYGPGMMQGYGRGPARNDGFGRRTELNLSAADVTTNIERRIAVMGNPRLKVGDVKEKDADTIEADIVTKQENALVERLSIDRHTGFQRPL